MTQATTIRLDIGRTLYRFPGYIRVIALLEYMRSTDMITEYIIHGMKANQQNSSYCDGCAFTRNGNPCELYACFIPRQATSVVHLHTVLRKLFPNHTLQICRLVPSICTDSKTPMARMRNRLPELIDPLDSTRFSTKSRRLPRKGDQSPDVSPHGVCMDPGHQFSINFM